MKQAVMSFSLQLEPRETKSTEIECEGSFVSRRLILNDFHRQYEMVRARRSKCWTNKLVVYGPPVEIRDIRIDATGFLTNPMPNELFRYRQSLNLDEAPPGRRLTLTFKSHSDEPYTLRGAVVGVVNE
jgi:hypothetical protein